MSYREEFDRRVRRALIPDHAEHDMSAVKVTWSGSDGDGCPTCGYEARADVLAKGSCGCGAPIWRVRSLTSAPYRPEHGDFIQRHDGNSNVHIADVITPDHGALKVTTACGAGWYSSALRHASEPEMYRRLCSKCWDRM